MASSATETPTQAPMPLDDSSSNDPLFTTIKEEPGLSSSTSLFQASSSKQKKEKNSEKRNLLSLQTKLQLLSDYDNRVGSRKEVAEKYGISSSTLSTIIKYRNKVEKAHKTFQFQPGRKRLRESQFSGIDKELLRWVEQAKQRNQPINGIVLAERAAYIATQLGITTFGGSSGWVDRFKKRYGITFTRKSSVSVLKDSGSDLISSTTNAENGAVEMNTYSAEIEIDRVNDDNTDGDFYEKLDFLTPRPSKASPTDGQAAKEWCQDSLPYILDVFHPKDIFCADETDLYYKCLPDKLQCLLQNNGPREKVTVMCSVNMTGVEKLPLLVVGKTTATARKIEGLPIDYAIETSTHTFAEHFESWLGRVDERFDNDGRRVALVLSSSRVNCSILPTSLRAIKIVYLPLQTSQLLQPCTHGILHSFKMHYRTHFIQKYLLHARNEISKGRKNCAESFHLSLSNALYLMRNAWDQVEKDTVVSSFRHAGFHARQSHAVIEEDSRSHLNHLLERLGQMVPVSTTANDFVDVDKDLQVAQKAGSSRTSSSMLNGSSDQENAPSVNVSAAAIALDTLKRFAQERRLNDEVFKALTCIESAIDNCAINELVLEDSTPVQKDDDCLIADDEDVDNASEISE